MKRSFTLQKAFTGSISIIDGQGEFSQGFWMPNDDGIEFSRKMTSSHRLKSGVSKGGKEDGRTKED